MRRARAERGQILGVVALALVALLGIAAFSIDVGYAYYAKRQLQSATDAAALAGAQDLPNGTNAIASATAYANANTPPNLTGFNFTYQVTCTATAISAAGCNAAVNPNQLTVSGTASTNTWFAKIFGINHFDVATHANACSPCASTPVDIVLAIDRTGSMCSPTGAGGTCTDLNNAKDGIRTMLAAAEPTGRTGRHGRSSRLCRRPPRTSAQPPTTHSAATATTATTPQPAATSPTRSTATTRPARRSIPRSGLYLHTVDGPASSCIQAGGNTSYSEALRQARAELAAHGRANIPDYIVFLTDGEANIGSVYSPTYPQNNADDQQPCHTAINLANTYKSQGVTIYSIGYALGSNVYCTAGDFTRRTAAGNSGRRLHGGNDRLLPLRQQQQREPRDHLVQHALADRVARRLLQPAERCTAEHDLRRDRSRHRPGREQAGG